MEGWGGIAKWKPIKESPKTSEKVFAYASDRFPVIKSTIDAEIQACINTLNSMKIHYLDQPEISLRTDCQAIISFYNKQAQNKPTRVRWINFTDFITGTGVNIKFEHIDGKFNILADHLSRLTNTAFSACFAAQEDIMEKDASVTDALQKTMGLPVCAQNAFELAKVLGKAIGELHQNPNKDLENQLHQALVQLEEHNHPQKGALQPPFPQTM